MPSSENKCPFPGSYGFRFQFQVDETLKDFWISDSTAKVETNASLKNEPSLGENCENIILQEIKQTECKSTKKQKVAKKRRIKRLICVRKVPYDDSHETLLDIFAWN